MRALVSGATVSSVHDTTASLPRFPAASTAVTSTSITPSLGGVITSVLLLLQLDDPSSAFDPFTRTRQQYVHSDGNASPPQPASTTPTAWLLYRGVRSVANVVGAIVSTTQLTLRGCDSTCPSGSVAVTFNE